MKQTVKRLLNDFPNIRKDLENIKHRKSMTDIAKHYSDLGYPCSEALIRRLFRRLEVETSHIRTFPGERNPFFGKKHDEKTKNRISKTRKEKGYAKGIKNYFYGKTGILSPNWKGGKSRRQALFYASQEWYDKRLEIMKRDGFSCRNCKWKAGSTRNSLNVHHITPLSTSWELRLLNENLITLCVPCHKKTFGKEKQFEEIFKDIVRTH